MVKKIELDKVLVAIAMLLLVMVILALFILHIYQPIGLIFALFLTCFFYLIKRDSLKNIFLEDRGSPSAYIQKRQNLVLWCVFGSGVFSYAVIRFSENIYQRPTWLLVSFLLPAILILMEILAKVYKLRGGELAIFLQTELLLLSLSLSSILTFPYNGSDTWAHLYNANFIFQNHSFSGLQGGYQNYPLFPLTLSMMMYLPGTDASQAARALVVFLISISLLLFFILSKDYYRSSQHALIAIFLLAGSKWFLYWSTLVVSMSTAIFIFMAFYLLISLKYFCSETTISQRDLSIGLLILAALSPFFHPVGSVAITILCLCYYLIDLLFFREEHKVKGSDILVLIGFVVVVTLTQWIFYGQTFAYAMKSLFAAIFTDSPYSLSLASIKSDIFTYSINNINFYILVCFAVIEIFRQIRIPKDRLSLFSGISGMFFLAFAYSTQLINFQALLPYRWLLFGTILLVLPAVNIFIAVLKMRSLWIKALVLCCFCLYFSGGYLNNDVNRDNPLYGRKMTNRYEITFSEYAGLRFAQEQMDSFHSPFVVDYRLWDYLKLVNDSEYLVYWNKYELFGRNIVFAYRDIYQQYRTAFLGDSIDSFQGDRPNLNVIYDSGDLKWLEWVPNVDALK